MAELAEVQGRLLERAAAVVRPGGRLVYAVCTLTRAETWGVADRFEAGHGDFTPVPTPDPFHPEAAPAARHLWWPQDTGGNGMFVAVWQRAGRAAAAAEPAHPEAAADGAGDQRVAE